MLGDGFASVNHHFTISDSVWVSVLPIVAIESWITEAKANQEKEAL
jgi:hypothetical protein